MIKPCGTLKQDLTSWYMNSIIAKDFQREVFCATWCFFQWISVIFYWYCSVLILFVDAVS